MKNLVFGLLVIGMFCFMTQTATAEEWYDRKGTLHQATVEQYLNGDPNDILATTGDWVVMSAGKAQQKKITSMDVYKEGALAVYACIKETAGEKTTLKRPAAEVAVVCMALLQKDFPWMLTKFGEQ